MPLTLDAACYLPVIDNIFALADRETLVALRGISKSFKHRADSILAHHIKVEFLLTHLENVAVFRAATIIKPADLWRKLGLPGRPRKKNIQWHAAFRCTLCMPGRPRKKDIRWHNWDAHEQGCRAILKHARVVNAGGLLSRCMYEWHSMVTSPVFRGLSNVHTLRHSDINLHSEPWAHEIPAKRVVMFSAFYVLLSSGGPFADPMKPSLPLGPLANGVEKLVVNLVDPRLLGADKNTRTKIGPRLLEKARKQMGILAPILGPMAESIPTIKYTFVNMLQVDRGLFAFDPDIDTHAKIHEILASCLVDIKAGTTGDRNQIARTVDSCLNFYTLDEYAATLTVNDFKLETDPGYQSPYIPNM